MPYDLGFVHIAVINHQSVDVILQLKTEEVNDSDIEDDNPIMAATSRTHRRQNEHNHIVPDRNANATIEANLPTLDEVLNAESTDAYCNKIRPIVEIPMSSFKLNKKGLLVRLSSIPVAVQ